MTDYLSLAIVGAMLAAFVQYVKTSGFRYPRLLVISGALGAGVGYYFIGSTAAWQAFLQVLVYANAVYAFLIKPFLPEE